MIDITAIKARANKASGQSWQAWNMVHGDTGKPMSPEEIGEYVKNSVLKSIEDGGSADQFLFVSFDGEGNPDICHVGNGPNRAANADFIAHARTDIPALIAALEASEASRVKAEQERDAFETGAKVVCIGTIERVDALEAERDHWIKTSRHAGVCMSCQGPRGAPEQYGCTDCLNTGWSGEYHNKNAELTDRITALEQERDALKAELEWYGEQARLARLIHSEGDKGRHALQDDGGKRARRALESKP